MRLVVRVRRAFYRKFLSCAEVQATKIQRLFQAFKLRQLRKVGFFQALLYLETKGRITKQSRVQLFGEFSAGSAQGAWG